MKLPPCHRERTRPFYGLSENALFTLRGNKSVLSEASCFGPVTFAQCSIGTAEGQKQRRRYSYEVSAFPAAGVLWTGSAPFFLCMSLSPLLSNLDNPQFSFGPDIFFPLHRLFGVGMRQCIESRANWRDCVCVCVCMFGRG